MWPTEDFSLLHAEDIFFSYQGPPIISKLNFVVNSGEIVRVSGPNGTGKTTLMRLLATLLKPQSGNFFVESDGVKLSVYNHLIAYLAAESNGLFPSLDALGNLSFWADMAGLGLSDEVLGHELSAWQLGSPLLRGFPVGRFSTGMKRRLSMARVALSRAPIWLLDEPLFGLDDRSIERVQHVICEHLSQGGIVVVVSHDMSLFEGLSYRDLILESGVL